MQTKLVERLVGHAMAITHAEALKWQACDADDEEQWERWAAALEAASTELIIHRLALYQLDQQRGLQ